MDQLFGPSPPHADSEPTRVPTLSSLCLKSSLSWFRQGFSSLPCWQEPGFVPARRLQGAPVELTETLAPMGV